MCGLQPTVCTVLWWPSIWCLGRPIRGWTSNHPWGGTKQSRREVGASAERGRQDSLQFSVAVFGSFSAVRQCTIWAYQPLVHFVWLPQERVFCVTCFMSKLVAPCSLMMFASGIASFLRKFKWLPTCWLQEFNFYDSFAFWIFSSWSGIVLAMLCNSLRFWACLLEEKYLVLLHQVCCSYIEVSLSQSLSLPMWIA